MPRPSGVVVTQTALIALPERVSIRISGSVSTGLGRPLGETAVVTGAVRPAAIEHLVARRGRSGFAAPPAHLHRGGIGAQDVALLVDHDQAVRQLVVNGPAAGSVLGPAGPTSFVLDGHSNPPNQREI